MAREGIRQSSIDVLAVGRVAEQPRNVEDCFLSRDLAGNSAQTHDEASPQGPLINLSSTSRSSTSLSITIPLSAHHAVCSGALADPPPQINVHYIRRSRRLTIWCGAASATVFCRFRHVTPEISRMRRRLFPVLWLSLAPILQSQDGILLNSLTLLDNTLSSRSIKIK